MLTRLACTGEEALAKGHKSGPKGQQFNGAEAASLAHLAQLKGSKSAFSTDTVNLPHHGSVVCSLFHPSTASTINLVCFLHRSVMQSAANRESVECIITIFCSYFQHFINGCK